MNAIAKEDKEEIKKYLEERILAIYAVQPELIDERLERLASVYESLDVNFLYVLDKVIKRGYGSLMTTTHIDYFLSILPEESKTYFMNNFWKELVKYNPLYIEAYKIVGLEIYSQI